MNTKAILAVLGVSALSAVACAQADLDLTYTESSLGGGLFSYDMTLSIDQTNGGFASGMGWTLIIFGDVANGATSPLADFSVTSAYPAPFGELASSSGGHDGPTWAFDSGGNLVYWDPTLASNTLTWAGTSRYDASTQGPMYFSELIVQGGAGQDSFKLMQPASSPEPASCLALAGAGAILLRRRAKK